MKVVRLSNMHDRALSFASPGPEFCLRDRTVEDFDGIA
jgi:hypothetical protein